MSAKNEVALQLYNLLREIFICAGRGGGVSSVICDSYIRSQTLGLTGCLNILTDFSFITLFFAEVQTKASLPILFNFVLQ